MKHSAKILISVLISFLIVWMGAGITMLHCHHTETTKFVVLADVADDSCAHKTDCMQAQVISLSPTAEICKQTVDIHTPVLNLPFFNSSLLAKPLYTANPIAKNISRLWYSLPRAYLAILRILRI